MSGTIACSGAAASRLLVRGAAKINRQPFMRFRAERCISQRQFSVASRLQEKKFTKDHEWVELADDKKTATVGITEYAAKALGDVVYVELPTVGTQVSAEEAIGAVESVKSASDILSPISGTITEVNEALSDTAALINKGPEGDGWFAKIEVGDAAEMEGLMDAEAYKAFTEQADDH